MATQVHSFPLPPLTGIENRDTYARMLLDSEPRFLDYDRAKKAAHRQWVNKESWRGLAGEFAGEPVDVNADGDSCQRVLSHDEDADDSDTTLSSSSCDETEDEASQSPRRVFGKDLATVSDVAPFAMLGYNPFGPIAALIARESQGSWHHSSPYSTQQILEFLEYDPATCWDGKTPGIVALDDILLSSQSPPTESEWHQTLARRRDRARTRRILHRLWKHGLRVRDLHCWLPPVDLQPEVEQLTRGLRSEWKKRKASHKRAIQFFGSLAPVESLGASSSPAHVNVDLHEGCWRGGYRFTTRPRAEDGTVEWMIECSQSLSDSRGTDAAHESPRKTVKIERRDQQPIDVDAPSSSDSESDAATSNQKDQSAYHPFHSAISGWEYYSAWNEPKHAHNRERYQQQYAHLCSKLARLHVGPAPGDAVETAVFLQHTRTLSGVVHENELTRLLFRWMTMPNDELNKARYQNSNFAMCARLRSIVLWMLLNVDVRLVDRLAQSISAPRSVAIENNMNMSAVNGERLRLWLGILPLFHAAGVDASNMRIQFHSAEWIDTAGQPTVDGRKCVVWFASEAVTSGKGEKHSVSQQQRREQLEEDVRAWFANQSPSYVVTFRCTEKSEQLQQTLSMSRIRGWAPDHMVRLMKDDLQLGDFHNHKNCERFLLESPQSLPESDARLLMMVDLNHYRRGGVRTFGYYSLIAWPELTADSSAPQEQTVLHPFWLAADTLHPSSYERSSLYRRGNVVYWNQLVRICVRHLALPWEQLLARILPDIRQASSLNANRALLACYRQAIVSCLDVLWD